MKQKDIALIIVIAFISGIATFFISKSVFTTAADRQQKVEIVEPITAVFQTPSPKYFNSSAFDPTQLVQIGNTTNPDPFNGATQ